MGDVSSTKAPKILNIGDANEWMTLAVAAQLAGVSTRTIRRWTLRGLLRCSRPGGGKCLVNRESLHALIEASVRSSASHGGGR